MHTIYNIGIYLLQFACRLLSLKNEKIKLMVQGQKLTFSKLQSITKEDKIAWFHCASLGEFEQARNLIESFKQEKKEYKILVSFFSPSGYEIRKNYKMADYVVYLPLDTPKNVNLFVTMAHPSIVFFVKYEFWYNYIQALKDIPLFQVSLILRKNHYLTKSYSSWFRKQLRHFNTFFVQDNTTKEVLHSLGYDNAIICGDTRFDRVFAISKEEKSFPIIDNFCKGGEKVFIAGSSWPADERIIHDALYEKENIKIILAPHQIHKEHISDLQKMFPSNVLYSQADEETIKNKRVLIIDCIGILSYIYGKGDITYVGGGFGAGIHNVLEAAVFYKPVAFGPNNKKFKEAQDLLQQQSAKEINNKEDLASWVEHLLTDEEYYSTSCTLNGQYVENNAGATQKILKEINQYL